MQYNDAIYFFLLLLKLYLLYLNKRKEIFESTISSLDQKLRKKRISHGFCLVCYRAGRWDFRFCGFGQFLVLFLGFRTWKLRFFGFGVFHGLRVFSNLVFGFRFSSTMMAVFRVFLSSAFCGFSAGFCQGNYTS